MNSIQIAVKLRTPDSAAVTALNAIKDMRLQLPPLKLKRYDLWDFEVSEGGRETVTELVGHFPDIVNPNKQIWLFPEKDTPLPDEDEEFKWIGIVVHDLEDSIASNWIDLLRRRGFPVKSLRCGVLWRFGYLPGTDDALVRKLAMELSVSCTRTGGLLSNPVFQEVSFWS